MMSGKVTKGWRMGGLGDFGRGGAKDDWLPDPPPPCMSRSPRSLARPCPCFAPLCMHTSTLCQAPCVICSSCVPSVHVSPPPPAGLYCFQSFFSQLPPGFVSGVISAADVPRTPEEQYFLILNQCGGPENGTEVVSACLEQVGRGKREGGWGGAYLRDRGRKSVGQGQRWSSAPARGGSSIASSSQPILKGSPKPSFGGDRLSGCLRH